jgi:hypothetical protein
MPADQIPTAAKYFAEHTPGQMSQRLFEGFLAIFVTTTKSYGYVLYFDILFGSVLTLALINWRRTLAIIKKYPFVTLFCAAFFSSYLLLYAWYWPISSGNRFVLALFSPAMFTLGFVMYRLFDPQLALKIKQDSQQTVHLGQLINWTIFAILLLDGVIILTERIGTLYGGF